MLITSVPPSPLAIQIEAWIRKYKRLELELPISSFVPDQSSCKFWCRDQDLSLRHQTEELISKPNEQ